MAGRKLTTPGYSVGGIGGGIGGGEGGGIGGGEGGGIGGGEGGQAERVSVAPIAQ